MSNTALTAVFKHSKSEGVARLVLLSIADRANEEGFAFCGNTDLCKRTNSSRRAVFRGLQTLKTLGEIKIESGGGRWANRFWVNPALLHADTGANSAPVPNMHGRGANLAPEVVPNMHPNPPINPPINPLNNPPLPISDEKVQCAEFVEEWNSLDGVSKIKDFGANRVRCLKARMRETFFRTHYETALERMAASSFCRGGGKSGWVASVDWFLRPGTVTALMEGKYDDQAPVASLSLPSVSREVRL